MKHRSSFKSSIMKTLTAGDGFFSWHKRHAKRHFLYIGHIFIVVSLLLTVPSCDEDTVEPPVYPKVELDKTSLNFTAYQNGDLPSAQTVTASNDRGAEIDWEVRAGESWLTVSPSSGKGSEFEVEIGPNTTGMSPAVCTTFVEFDSEDALKPETTLVYYTLQPECPLLESSCDEIEFVYQVDPDSSLLVCQSCVLTNVGGDTIRDLSISTNVAWLTVSYETSPEDPNNVLFDICPAPAGFDAGTYTGNVIIGSSNACNSPLSIPAKLTLIGRPLIVFDPDSLVFEANLGDIPDPVTLLITNGGGGTLQWTLTDKTSWLTEYPTADASNAKSVEVKVKQNTLEAGYHYDTITIASSNAINSPQMVPVSYKVQGPCIQVIPSSIALNAKQNEAVPAGVQEFTIVNCGGGTLQWQVSEDAAWLDIKPQTSGSGDATLQAQVIDTDRDPGRYTTTMTILSPNAENSPFNVPVTLDIQGPEISVDATSLSFSAEQYGDTPASQSFTISNVGGGDLVWEISYDLNGFQQQWLRCVPQVGVTPLYDFDEVGVEIRTTDLESGTYTATILIGSNDADDPQTQVDVTYEVSEAPPQISVQPGLMKVEAFRNGPLPGDEAIIVSNTGGGTLTWTATADCNWVELDPSSGGGLGHNDSAEITVSITDNDLPADLYVCTITLTGSGGSATVVIEYTVKE